MLVLPARTRVAWGWDMATGLLAGAYMGCIWTFVGRVARADLRASDAQMGWIAAAPALGYLFATVWARQMEGRAKLPFVYWTWLAARGLFMLAPLVRTREQLAVLVCLSPFVFSVSTPAYTSVMKDIYPDDHRGRLMSVVRIGMSVVTLVCSLMMGRLLDAGLNWRVAFAFGGACGALSALTFSRIAVPAPKEETPGLPVRAFLGDTLAILRRNPGYRWFTASVFVYGFGNLMATTLYPMYQVDRFHVTNTQVANLQNIASVSTIAGFFYWGWFMDRKGPLITVLLCIGVVCLMPLFYAVARDVSLLYLAAAAGGIAMSGIDLGYLNTTLLFSEPGRAAQYQALHSSFFGIRGSIAPHCAVPLQEHVGMRPAFAIALLIMLAGTALQVVSMRGYRGQQAARRRGAPV
ncbi:MAG: MFS transporter [Chthonomonadales bacterium]|nr:MFS transporter [Chthonomonadales bacterium]